MANDAIFVLGMLLCFIVYAKATPTPWNTNPRAGEGLSVRARSRYLSHVWAEMYGLGLEDLSPPATILRPNISGGRDNLNPRTYLPLPPHLEDCAYREGQHQEADTWREAAVPPLWVGGGSAGGTETGPRPPWVHGSDADNLPLTRQAQTAIWHHQRPADCSREDLRFAVVIPDGNDPGSLLQHLSNALSLAMVSKRVLVIKQQDCEGSKPGISSLDCYFGPATTPACVNRALEMLSSPSAKGLEEAGLNSTAGVVIVKGHTAHHEAAEIWGSPWKGLAAPAHGLGEDAEEWELKELWWRAQSSRYFLRWPTPTLCHAVNRIRHTAFGASVANRIAMAEDRQRFAARQAFALPEYVNDFNDLSEIDLGKDPLERAVWREVNPFVNLPIVSVDAGEGGSLQNQMWVAERLRFRIPNLKHVWLTALKEAEMSECKEHTTWHFHHSENQRMQRLGKRTAMNALSPRGRAVIAFANVVLAGQCDMFVGSLSSPTNQLVNQLRLTNGKLKAGYINVR